ncbi:MAG TPA: hypothetical protein VGD68_16665 [Streptosporangiaceae bacterium]
MAIASAAMILLVAGGTAFWLHGISGTASTPHHKGSVAVKATRAASTGQAAPPPSEVSPTQSVTGGGTVAVDSSVAQDPDSQAIAAFLDGYFSAINSHDYQSYMSLLSPQEQEEFTEAQFDSGYGSTTDSAETLTGISAAGTGDTIASLTFTSNQDTAQSVDQSESCTNWNISLYLQSNGSSYLIDPPPPDYHATHSACS